MRGALLGQTMPKLFKLQSPMPSNPKPYPAHRDVLWLTARQHRKAHLPSKGEQSSFQYTKVNDFSVFHMSGCGPQSLDLFCAFIQHNQDGPIIWRADEDAFRSTTYSMTRLSIRSALRATLIVFQEYTATISGLRKMKWKLVF